MPRTAAPVPHPAASRPHRVRLTGPGQLVQHPVNRRQAGTLTPGAKRLVHLPGSAEPVGPGLVLAQLLEFAADPGELVFEVFQVVSQVPGAVLVYLLSPRLAMGVGP